MYRSALKQDLRFGEAFYRLGLIDLKLAAYGDAAQMLLRAASLQPDNQDAATKLAELYLIVAPFASLIAVLAVQRAFVLPPLLMEGGSVAIVAAVIALSWRRTPDLQPGKFGLRYGFGSLIVGAAAFLLWIAPDVLIPGYRHHPWFENPLFGKFVPGLSEAARA